MKVGDIVEWRSQAAAYTRTKRGEIIEVVRAHHRSKFKRKDRGRPRNHESYVVRAVVIDGSEAQKTRKALYWPRVTQLTLVEES
jgi:hypothetical protein